MTVEPCSLPEPCALHPRELPAPPAHERIAAEIRNWAASYGYVIEVCAEPHEHRDAIGQRAASPHAQLCANRVIAVASEPCVDQLYSVAHEMAHGERPGQSEELVQAEAAAMLAKLASWALGGVRPQVKTVEWRL